MHTLSSHERTRTQALIPKMEAEGLNPAALKCDPEQPLPADLGAAATPAPVQFDDSGSVRPPSYVSSASSFEFGSLLQPTSPH